MSYQFDHRQLADEMEIYFINEQIGAGLPVWLPNGVAIRDALEAYIKALEHEEGYQRVSSPHLAKDQLYQLSGHLKSYSENMYPPIQWPEDNSNYYLRPMNCPHHHKVFSSQLRSYRDLPLRIAEYGQVYRFENSGSLKGLSRVRGLCQNDAHIYLDPNKALEEIVRVLDLHERCYKDIGLKGYKYRLSKHDPEKVENYEGPQRIWIQCESILHEALESRGLPYYEAEGEAAFYAPKIDIQMRMHAGPDESISSIQLDFNSAQSFDLEFINSSGQKERPWIIHRAPLGSHERFVALLLEYFDGKLPGWLSPVQLSIIPIGNEAFEKADQISRVLRRNGLRVYVDKSSGSLSKRVLMAHKHRPFSKLILGRDEIKSKQVSIQLRDRIVDVHIDQIWEFLCPILKISI